MKERFRGLRLVALVWKGIGLLVLMAGLLLGASIAQGTLYIPFVPLAEPYSIGILVSAAVLFAPFLLGFLLFYGGGGALEVLIAVEKNTRGATKEASLDRPREAEEPSPGEPRPAPKG